MDWFTMLQQDLNGLDMLRKDAAPMPTPGLNLQVPEMLRQQPPQTVASQSPVITDPRDWRGMDIPAPVQASQTPAPIEDAAPPLPGKDPKGLQDMLSSAQKLALLEKTRGQPQGQLGAPGLGRTSPPVSFQLMQAMTQRQRQPQHSLAQYIFGR